MVHHCFHIVKPNFFRDTSEFLKSVIETLKECGLETVDGQLKILHPRVAKNIQKDINRKHFTIA
ncbi:Uncharacterised protein [Enterobacter hormaechei]|nr:Uncharacterised protein [Enterobacter hormaechei]VAK55823.1 Uncharacterised protein [Enterobacter hormaechei]VAL04487.1 Uncharacterised protein [Enterobacter hormaechei]VAL85611.1 Uncharacterised protein [Enterobacter hormaechei]VAL92498.1 Uncharacterised protein [Enterobacter hormaechei]